MTSNADEVAALANKIDATFEGHDVPTIAVAMGIVSGNLILDMAEFDHVRAKRMLTIYILSVAEHMQNMMAGAKETMN